MRDAFLRRGHDAWSCDLLPSKTPGPHLQCDVFVAIEQHGPWDLGIFHPPCTYLSSSGMHWTTRGLRDARLTEEALEVVRRLMVACIPGKVLENPVGAISTRIRKPDQIIQPWMFGHDASKATCLWLDSVPPLTPTKHIPPRVVLHDGKWALRWANQTDSGQNKLPPTPDRWDLRSETYLGVADAFAEQWSNALVGADLV